MKDKADGVERILTADAAYPTSAAKTILTAGHYVRRRRWRWLPWPTELVLVEAPRMHVGDLLYHASTGEVVRVECTGWSSLEPVEKAEPVPSNDRGPH